MNPLPPTLRTILESARVKHFPSGQILLYKGDAADEVYVIKSGAVKLYDIDDDGNEKILHIVSSPSLIPFVFFYANGSTIHWFYSALTDCEVYVLSAAQLEAAMLLQGKLAHSLIRRFTSDVHELLVRLSSMNKTNVQSKVMAALKFLAVCHSDPKVGGWYEVRFPVNQQLVADLAGVTRESTAVVMKEFQEQGILRTPKLGQLRIRLHKI